MENPIEKSKFLQQNTESKEPKKLSFQEFMTELSDLETGLHQIRPKLWDLREDEGLRNPRTNLGAIYNKLTKLEHLVKVAGNQNKRTIEATAADTRYIEIDEKPLVAEAQQIAAALDASLKRWQENIAGQVTAAVKTGNEEENARRKLSLIDSILQICADEVTTGVNLRQMNAKEKRT